MSNRPVDRTARILAPRRPVVLHAAVARMSGPSSELVWDGRVLRYRAWRGGDASTGCLDVPVLPDPGAWERFWAALDAAGVWSWRGRYDAAGCEEAEVLPGPGWVLRVAYGRRSVDCSGLAAFPDGTGGRPGPAFRRLCRELSALAGNRPVG